MYGDFHLFQERKELVIKNLLIKENSTNRYCFYLYIENSLQQHFCHIFSQF